MNPAVLLIAIIGGSLTAICLIVGVFMDLEDRRLYRAAGYTMTPSRTRTRVTKAQAAYEPEPVCTCSRQGDCDCIEEGVPWHALVISSLSLSLRGEFQNSPNFNKDARMSASNSKTELQGSVPSTK